MMKTTRSRASLNYQDNVIHNDEDEQFRESSASLSVLNYQEYVVTMMRMMMTMMMSMNTYGE